MELAQVLVVCSIFLGAAIGVAYYMGASRANKRWMELFTYEIPLDFRNEEFTYRATINILHYNLPKTKALEVKLVEGTTEKIQ